MNLRAGVEENKFRPVRIALIRGGVKVKREGVKARAVASARCSKVRGLCPTCKRDIAVADGGVSFTRVACPRTNCDHFKLVQAFTLLRALTQWAWVAHNKPLVICLNELNSALLMVKNCVPRPGETGPTSYVKRIALDGNETRENPARS